MKTVKIYFVDFWDGFDPNNNFFTRLLSVKYDLVIDPVSPDYVFYSCFSFNIYKYPNAVKIYFTGEMMFLILTWLIMPSVSII